MIEEDVLPGRDIVLSFDSYFSLKQLYKKMREELAIEQEKVVSEQTVYLSLWLDYCRLRDALPDLLGCSKLYTCNAFGSPKPACCRAREKLVALGLIVDKHQDEGDGA